MPRKAKSDKQTEEVEQSENLGEDPPTQPNKRPKAQTVEPTQPASVYVSKDDYIKARAVIKSYRELQKSRPKRKCSEKQLQALAEGRAKNSRAKSKKEAA